MGSRKTLHKQNEVSYPMKQKPRRLNKRPRNRDKYWLDNNRAEENEGEWLPGLCVYESKESEG